MLNSDQSYHSVMLLPKLYFIHDNYGMNITTCMQP